MAQINEYKAFERKKGDIRFRKDNKLVSKDKVPEEIREQLKQLIEVEREQEVVERPVEQSLGPKQEEASVDVLSLIGALRQEIEELRQLNPQAQNATSDQKLDELIRMQGGASVGSQGVQGVVQKYPVEASHYPDPRDRLYDLPELKRYAMRDNYIITYEVQGVTYEKQNVTFTEPRHVIHLYRRLYDDDGTDSGKVALVNRHYMGEDELVTKIASQKLGLDINKWQEAVDEVRFLRIKQWLLDLFRPVNIQTKTRQKTVQVIDGKAVEVYDTESVTDGDSGIAKANAVKGQSGIGQVRL